MNKKPALLSVNGIFKGSIVNAHTMYSGTFDKRGGNAFYQLPQRKRILKSS